MTEYWEPWQPKVGDRIKVRWQPECPHGSEISQLADGLAGLVAEINTSDETGHFYRVAFDEPGRLPVPVWMYDFGPWAAALELEPLS